MKALEELLGKSLASALLDVAHKFGLDVSIEEYSVGKSMHISGKDAPQYDIVLSSLPYDRRTCVELLLDHMFPKREVKIEDFSEIVSALETKETV